MNRKHTWISNREFTRRTGLAKVCMDCGLGLETGERLTTSERVCPGRPLSAFHQRVGDVLIKDPA